MPASTQDRETVNEAPSTPTRLPVDGQSGPSFPNTPSGDHQLRPAEHPVGNGSQGMSGGPGSGFGQPPGNLRRDPQDNNHWHILPSSNGFTTPGNNFPRGQATCYNTPRNHPQSGLAPGYITPGNRLPSRQAAGYTPRIHFPMNNDSPQTAPAAQPISDQPTPRRRPIRPQGLYTPPKHRQEGP